MNDLGVRKKSRGRWFPYPWYPIVFGMYPVLALLSANAGQIQPAVGSRALLVSVVVAAGSFFSLWLVIRHVHRAAFLATLLLALFFSYGHVHNLLGEKYPDFDSDVWLVSGWGIFFLLAIFWSTRPKLNFAPSAASLNVIALGLVFISSWPILSGWQLSSGSVTRTAHALGADNAPVQSDLIKPDNPPDVYYFILDSYGRADGLYAAYGYDNSGFLSALEERGFYVAECSQSNYVRTDISLASSLNMMYLQDLDDEFQADSKARRTLWDSLQHSAARRNFELMGYKIVSFSTGFRWNELQDADLFLEPPPFSSSLTEFEGLFLRTTMARYVQTLGWVDADAVMAQAFRDRFNNIFNHVDDIAGMPEPTFAHIHVISPHPPFVFDADGNPTHPADFWDQNRKYPAKLYAAGYQNQLTYLNGRLLQAIDTILANSNTPPIIILQGDHGPWLQPKNERMWVLNAYYVPGYNDSLYPTISPVNTFRLIFNSYFGGKYDMLEDVSYFSPVPKIYDFSEFPNDCNK